MKSFETITPHNENDFGILSLILTLFIGILEIYFYIDVLEVVKKFEISNMFV